MRVTLALAAIAGLTTPAARAGLEGALASHALVQLPLLVLLGLVLGRAVETRWPGQGGFNDDGIPGLVLASGVAAIWMLPRSMDAALTSGWVEALKFASVPGLVGLPLGASWSRLGPVARSFVLANGVSMLWTLGWLYAIAPVRVCNFYLRGDQALLGQLYLGLGFALLGGALLRAICGPGLAVGLVARFASRPGRRTRAATARLAGSAGERLPSGGLRA